MARNLQLTLCGKDSKPPMIMASLSMNLASNIDVKSLCLAPLYSNITQLVSFQVGQIAWAWPFAMAKNFGCPYFPILQLWGDENILWANGVPSIRGHFSLLWDWLALPSSIGMDGSLSFFITKSTGVFYLLVRVTQWLAIFLWMATFSSSVPNLRLPFMLGMWFCFTLENLGLPSSFHICFFLPHCSL